MWKSSVIESRMSHSHIGQRDSVVHRPYGFTWAIRLGRFLANLYMDWTDKINLWSESRSLPISQGTTLADVVV